jgi:hypothetical protein
VGSHPRGLGNRRGRTQIAFRVDGGLEGGRRDRSGVLSGPARQRVWRSAAGGLRPGAWDHPGDRGMLYLLGAPALSGASDAQSRGQGPDRSMAEVQGASHRLLSGAPHGRSRGNWRPASAPITPRPAERAHLFRRRFEGCIAHLRLPVTHRRGSAMSGRVPIGDRCAGQDRTPAAPRV